MRAASSVVERKARSQAFARFQRPVETRLITRDAQRRRAIHFHSSFYVWVRTARKRAAVRPSSPAPAPGFPVRLPV